MLTENLIHKVSKLLTNEEKFKLLLWVGEIELIRAKKESHLKEEKRVIKRSETDHQLFINTTLFDIIVQRELKKPSIKRYEGQQTLTGEIEPYRVRPGIITVFQKAMVIGNPKDAISYYLNKRGRKFKYGEFVGFIYTEIPVIPAVQNVTRYLVKEPDIERRKKLRRALRKQGVKRYIYDKYLKHNTLIKFNDPNFKPKTPKQRADARDRKLAKRMKKDPKNTRK